MLDTSARFFRSAMEVYPLADIWALEVGGLTAVVAEGVDVLVSGVLESWRQVKREPRVDLLRGSGRTTRSGPSVGVENPK
jgi:hypothetical protein